MKYLTILSFCFFLFACETEELSAPNHLVPFTVVEDPSLPSIAVNGTQLHAQTFGNSEDPMLVFLHGGPGGDYRNGLNVQQLAQDGYFVVFYDQRGSGLSQRHDQASYSIQVMLDDLSAVIEYYRSSTSQKVFLFGHSWGAMLAAAYIDKYPDNIDGVIFAEPGGFNKDLLDRYAESSRKIKLFSEVTNDILYYDQFLAGDTNDHAILDYKLSLAYAFAYDEGNTEGIEGPFPFWRNGAVVLNSMVEIAEEEGFDFTTNLPAFPTRVLFIYGGLNESYGLSFAQTEAQYFQEADLVEIPGTGHEMIHFKWELVYPVVLNYLNSLI